MSRPNGIRPTRSGRPAGCKTSSRRAACRTRSWPRRASTPGRCRGGPGGPCRLSAGSAAFATSRVRPRRRVEVERGAPGSMGDPSLAPGLCPARALRPVVRSADALVASPRGGGARARFSGNPDHPEPHRPAGGSQRRGGPFGAGNRRWRLLAGRSRTSPGKISGLGQPGRPWTVESNRAGRAGTPSRFLASNAACSPATSRSTAWVADFRYHLRWLQDDRRGLKARAEQAALFYDNAIRIYRLE